MLTVRRLTPCGTGALAVVALTGDLPDVLRNRWGGSARWPEPGRVLLARLHIGDHTYDEALVLGREGGAELHLHGGATLVDAVLAALQSTGATWAATPESRSVSVRSLAAARCLASHRWGPLAALAQRCRRALDTEALDASLLNHVREALARRTLGRRLIEPAIVRLVGRTNAGKSTLFNAMLGSRRALVSPRSGTTRDTVTALVLAAGIPIELEDTAGVAIPGMQTGADLVVHLLSPGDPPGRDRDDDPGWMEVRGRSDLDPEGRGVSGLTGLGVDGLLVAIADRLGLSALPEDHVLAPALPDLVMLLEGCLAAGEQEGR